jgi:hypothetical protein
MREFFHYAVPTAVLTACVIVAYTCGRIVRFLDRSEAE